VKVAVHRLRQRFRELLRVEVAHTCAARRTSMTNFGISSASQVESVKNFLRLRL
jgi:hypothetical protein